MSLLEYDNLKRKSGNCFRWTTRQNSNEAYRHHSLNYFDMPDGQSFSEVQYLYWFKMYCFTMYCFATMSEFTQCAFLISIISISNHLKCCFFVQTNTLSYDLESKLFIEIAFQALLAQWIARWTSNPKVVGSSRT